ncbi:MAG: pilus assembly protein TadB [Caulobacter sp.]|jgi:tight adherence protein B|nr:pilus assembly protein TadB [Caulobacter sp.]
MALPAIPSLADAVRDPHLAIFLVLVFAAVFTAVQAATGLLRAAHVKIKVNRRLVVADRVGSVADRVIELRKERGLNEAGERRIGWKWFGELVLKAGVVYRPRRWTLICIGIAMGVAAPLYLFLHSPLIAGLAGPVAAVLLPITYLRFRAARRLTALGRQLPDALEIIVRSLEAGHPVPTAISLVGREMVDPIGTEFGLAADEMAYGATLEQVIGRLADRCRQPDVDLFAATIRLQEKAGGNLTGLLKMNASTVRERQKMRLKIKAASAEGKASAVILTSAPFCVLALLTFASPHFYGDVIHEKPIQIGLAVLGTWMFLGNLVMRRMIDMRI